MSDKELCIQIINEFPEEQLRNVLNILENLKEFFYKTNDDDDFCKQLLNEYENCDDIDKNETMTIQDFSKELGIDLK